MRRVKLSDIPICQGFAAWLGLLSADAPYAERGRTVMPKAATNLLTLLFIAVPLTYRSINVGDAISKVTGMAYTLAGAQQVLYHDAPIYLALLGASYLSCLPRIPLFLAGLLRIMVLLTYLAYLLDIYIFQQFFTRLVYGDVWKYFDYAPKYVRQTHGWFVLSLLLAALAVLAWGMARLVFRRFPFLGMKQQAIVGVSAVALLGAAVLAEDGRYMHAWMYANLFEYNQTIRSQDAPYSDEFIQSLRHDDSETCQPGVGHRRNIILLMVESLSNYQSKLFSGLRDWTPNIDAIARNNLYFTRFHANGFNTEDGEIALLTGLYPVHAPGLHSDAGSVSFVGYMHLADTLPKRLKSKGYATEFLASADLEFANTGTWVRRLGFDVVEGHDNPGYEGWQRYHFQAAPDEALYRRVQARIAAQSPLGNYFLFVKTTSTHHPYFDPETGLASEQKAFEYADKQLGRFYRQLEQSGFFENGILVIVGDHHAMVPLRREEIEQYGPRRAAAMIPMIVATGGRVMGREDWPFQQVDIFNGIRNEVDGQRCLSDWRGDVLRETRIPPRFIVHKRGDNRDLISVFNGESAWLVKLDGDNTHALGDQDESERGRVTDKINHERILRLRDSQAAR